MIALGLDTALQRCSVALVSGDVVLASEAADMERGHAEHLAPMAARVFAAAGVAPGDLDRVGVVIGPGGFTGVRIALAFARAMGLAIGAPVVGIASLEALAAAAGPGLVASVVDARRGQVYAGLYEDGAPVLAPFAASPEDAIRRLGAAGREALFVGTGAGLLPPDPARRYASIDPQIDAAIVARLALARPAPEAPPAPLYLRPPDARPARP